MVNYFKEHLKQIYFGKKPARIAFADRPILPAETWSTFIEKQTFIILPFLSKKKNWL
jgi:hypothetical protein